MFPGAVPRTFFGGIVLAWLTTPVLQLATLLKFTLAKSDLQIIGQYSSMPQSHSVLTSWNYNSPPGAGQYECNRSLPSQTCRFQQIWSTDELDVYLAHNFAVPCTILHG